MNISEISKTVYEYAKNAEDKAYDAFKRIDEIAEQNTLKVMKAFQENRVSESCFSGTTGYGYDDLGRDTLDRIFADIFGCESAIVRLGFVNGTHAITNAIFSLCAPGEAILSVTGEPYDTLRKAIGISGDEFGSLKFYGIDYYECLFDEIDKYIKNEKIKGIIMQRSCGYDDRDALSLDKVGEMCMKIKSIRPDINIFVDNCYGEFTDVKEPTEVGADLIAGSLIKNPGGGIAPTGAYIAGKKQLVERAANRLTSPGIGGECGSTLGNNRLLYQGLFLAPHTVAQALKTSVFAAAIMDEIGIECKPKYYEPRYDLIERIMLKDPDKMKKFCLGIQAGAPVDSYVTPEPWAMPGYDCDVIMADGSFIQGSSIELSADGPFKEPYNVYLQGGLTYESGKLGIMMAVSAMLDN